MTPAVLLLLTLLGLCALGALILWHACIAALLRTCKRAPAPDFTESNDRPPTPNHDVRPHPGGAWSDS